MWVVAILGLPITENREGKGMTVFIHQVFSMPIDCNDLPPADQIGVSLVTVLSFSILGILFDFLC